MSWVNFDDVRSQIEAVGILIDKPLVPDGRIQRWKTTESRGSDKPGWSRLREWVARSGDVYIVGAFGVWHGTDDGYTKVQITRKDQEARKLSEEDLEALRAAQKAAAKALADERKLEAKRAAAWASQVWSRCRPVGQEGHEYLTRKGIQDHGTRVWEGRGEREMHLDGIDDANVWRLMKSEGALVVPMHDVNGNVVGLQLIYPKGHEFGDKGFWPSGMAMGGSFGVIGGWRRHGVLLMAEGFATAATLHEATRLPVVYAFSANNLGKAARTIRAKYPAVHILICGDDDAQTEEKTGKNPGRDAAQLAASEIERAAWMVPDFRDEEGRDRRDRKKLSDFNDLAALVSPIAVANQVADKLTALGWRDDRPAGVGLPQRGDGGRRRAEAVMALDDIVERFVPIDDGTGKYVFDTWTRKIAHRDQMIALLPAGVRGDDIKRHPLWIERGGCFIDEVGFDPTEKDENVRLNTWLGWPLKPKPGSCERILDLLRYLCTEDERGEEIYRWVLKWMAYPLQHPGAKMGSAIVMHGPQGTGKSTLWHIYARIYGDYATVLNQRGLEDRFNADWVDSKLFVLAEEVVARQEMWHIKNELKELITGDWVRVNPKNVAAYRQRNQINFVFLSNENQPVPLENDDRRHCVIYTPPAVDASFYDEVWREVEQGGVEAFYHYLLNLDLGDFHAKARPPMTHAKRDLIELSAPSEMRFARDWISGDLGLPICPALSMDVYAAYLRWCRENGEPRPRPSNHFLNSISRMQGFEKRKAHVYDDAYCSGTAKQKWLIFPPEAALQAAGTARPDGKTVSVWLTEQTLEFRSKMGIA
jgi:putative DNA primase/helicase